VLASHISTSLSFVHGEEHGFEYTMEMCARTLSTKGTRINAAQNQRIHDLYGAVLREIARLLRAESAQLLTVDVQTQELRMLGSSTEATDSEELPALCTLSSACAAARAVAGRRPVVDNGAPAAEGRAELGVLCCPVFDSRGEVAGVLQASGRAGFGEADVELLEGIIGDLAFSLEGTGSSLGRMLRKLTQQAAPAA